MNWWKDEKDIFNAFYNPYYDSSCSHSFYRPLQSFPHHPVLTSFITPFHTIPSTPPPLWSGIESWNRQPSYYLGILALFHAHGWTPRSYPGDPPFDCWIIYTQPLFPASTTSLRFYNTIKPSFLDKYVPSDLFSCSHRRRYSNKIIILFLFLFLHNSTWLFERTTAALTSSSVVIWPDANPALTATISTVHTKTY